MKHESREPALSRMPGGQQTDADESAVAQLLSLFRALRASPHLGRLALLTIAIIIVICTNAAGQIRLNVWQRDFFNALEQRAISVFADQLLVFMVIVCALLVLVVAQTWLQEMLKVRLRAWLTHDLLDQWLLPKRACLLAFSGPIGVNPDQRMHEDARHLSELSADLAVGLLQASLLLVSFIGVLWVLSAQVLFIYDGRSFAIPGYMVWCALAYAVGGSWLAWRVGRPLIAFNAERYAREAELRFALVRINEHAEGIALHGGERDERDALNGTVERVVGIMVRLANGLARLTWVTSGYGWLAIVVPILVAAPGYFGGDLSFGGLMMVVGAFNQVQQALRWFVDNFPRIADWRATLLRVVTFRDALMEIEALGEHVGHITFVDHEPGNLVIDDLSVTLADGRAALDQSRVEVAPGDHILIVGEPGSGKSTLFRALAGLWPWGSGTIRLPARETVMFMPQRPYLPLGSLRAAVSYPSETARFADAAVRSALKRVDLGHLVASLDRDDRWDKELSLDEQQRLAFARLLLHAPRWVLLDDGTGALEDEHRQLVRSIFKRELAGTAVIDIGRAPGRDHFYTRKLRLVRQPGGARLRAGPRPRLVEPAAALV